MKFSPALERCRVVAGETRTRPGDRYGHFFIMGPSGDLLLVVASDGTDPITQGWEHVSVSKRRHIPNWLEMSFVKDLFWSDDEAVMQLHPPKSDHVNNHPRCLHLWRPTRQSIPLPPAILVGVKSVGTLKNAKEVDAVLPVVERETEAALRKLEDGQ